MTETQVNFSTKVDIELEVNALLSHYYDFIAAGRQLLPKLTLYTDEQPFLTIDSRTYDEPEDGSEADRNKAIMEMLYLMPPLAPELAILSFSDPVKLTTGLEFSVIILAVNRLGALCKVFPYTEFEGETTYDMDAQLDPHSPQVYSQYVQHMLQVFVRTRKMAQLPTELIAFLSNKGHEVSLLGEFDENNLNTRFYF